MDIEKDPRYFFSGDPPAISAEKISHNLPSNVVLRGEIIWDEIVDLYARCRGHICTSIDEDFGLTPLEAMASGNPVIAVDEGGFRETVTPGTGLLISASQDIIIDTVKSLSGNPESFKHACIERAKESDLNIFKEKNFIGGERCSFSLSKNGIITDTLSGFWHGWNSS